MKQIQPKFYQPHTPIRAFQLTHEVARAHLMDSVELPFGIELNSGSFNASTGEVHSATAATDCGDAALGEWIVRRGIHITEPMTNEQFIRTYKEIQP